MANFNFVTQTIIQNTNAGTLTAVCTLTAASGLYDIISIGAYYGGGTITAITDNLGTPYAKFVNNNPSSLEMALWFGRTTNTGTATITLSATATANTSLCIIASDYTAPANFTIIFANQGMNVSTNTIISNIFEYLFRGNIGTATEMLALSYGFNTNTGTVWSISTGTVRGTGNIGAVSMFLGDLDLSNAGGKITQSTMTQTTAGTRGYLPLALLAYGTGGLIVENGWTGGFNG